MSAAENFPFGGENEGQALSIDPALIEEVDQLRSSYDWEVHAVRSAAFREIQKHGTRLEAYGWLWYHIYPDHANLDSDYPDDDHRVLLHYKFPAKKLKERPYHPIVRILDYESAKGPDQHGFIARDVTIFPDDTSAFCMDALLWDVGTNDFAPGLVPLYMVLGGKPRFPDVIGTTPTQVSIDETDPKGIRPFGVVDNPIDQEYALRVADEILRMIGPYQPDCVGPK